LPQPLVPAYNYLVTNSIFIPNHRWDIIRSSPRTNGPGALLLYRFLSLCLLTLIGAHSLHAETFRNESHESRFHFGVLQNSWGESSGTAGFVIFLLAAGVFPQILNFLQV